jgi:predicted Fe-Mo cluster-binding NifX family protein
MKIVVSANGASLDAPASPVFGRCPMYVFVDTDSMAAESVENPAISAGGGAGIQAAQFVVERGAQAVVSGNVGPNAFNVFQSASVPMYLFDGGTVRDAVEAFRSGKLQSTTDANVQAHAGMGMGRRAGGAFPQTPPADPAPSQPAASQEEEIAYLKDMAGGLGEQLSGVLMRLDQLEKGEGGEC